LIPAFFFGLGLRPDEVKQEFPGLGQAKKVLEPDWLQVRAPDRFGL
jgi:hypothetical protein